MKKNENFRKFTEICEDFSVFISVFQDYWSIITEDSKYKFNAEIFFEFFFRMFEFWGDFHDFLVVFGITHSSKFPEDPEE